MKHINAVETQQATTTTTVHCEPLSGMTHVNILRVCRTKTRSIDSSDRWNCRMSLEMCIQNVVVNVVHKVECPGLKVILVSDHKFHFVLTTENHRRLFRLPHHIISWLEFVHTFNPVSSQAAAKHLIPLPHNVRRRQFKSLYYWFKNSFRPRVFSCKYLWSWNQTRILVVERMS